MQDALECAPIGVLTVRDGAVRACNAEASRLLEVSDPRGDPVEAVFPQSMPNSVPAALDGESVTDVAAEEYYPDVERWLSVSVVPTSSARAAADATVYVEDVTEQRRTERARERLAAEHRRVAVVDRLIADILTDFVDATSRDEITTTICDRLGAADQYRFAWVGRRADADAGLRIDDVTGREGATFEAVRDVVERGADIPEQRAVDRGDLQVVDSMSGDETVPESLRVAAFADGVQSVLALPLVYGATVYGVVGVYADTQEAFTEHERASFGALGELAGLAITAARNQRLLLDDTHTEVTFELPSTSPLVSLGRACEATLTLEGTVPHGDGTLICFLSVAAANPHDVVDAADALSAVPRGRVIRGDGDQGGRIELVFGDATPLGLAVARGGTVRTAAVEDGTGSVCVELPAGASVRRMATALGDDGPATVLTRRDRARSPTTTRRLREELSERLTERQATVLRTAYLADYFESPRGSTAEEVADSLGITGSTLLYHLRASQRKLLDAYYETAADEDA
jgi:DNA-binding CsgD family transcriptional regulator